jgi:hypothetical protein
MAALRFDYLIRFAYNSRIMAEIDKVGLTTQAGGQTFHFRVDRVDLSREMKLWQKKAREMGQRPGALISPANPHSADIMAVQDTLYKSFAEKEPSN